MSDPDWTLLAHDQHYPAGALYVVATPIGNAADVSLRARHVLGLVDAVACEDTRNTGQLLHRLGLSRPMLAAHEHNEREAAARIVERLSRGERVAYASDAGTPGISDPGARIVEAVRAAGHRVIPLPGPSAVVTALSAAGELLASSDGRFTFVGFLPAKAGARDSAIRQWAGHGAAWVLYEAPHRIDATLAALAEHVPARRVLIGRELTKLFEQIVVLPAAEAPSWLAADPAHGKGEFVLVVEGAGTQDAAPTAMAADQVLRLLLAELPAKRAAKLAGAITGAPVEALYQSALALKNEGKD